ncbi:hypothetical protein SAMN04488028_101373 [Reichenbachiella agariperforans]|uniref:Uncharacterized protein n=1 Tax=Reichenbachiella agariperforans TaxID=156994 RepID=A0A1M6JYH6_REIAG|nr:hypothetical protein [Reichenbachiella agariperforans]SHJ51779.1 hypothetical protein SAMN04488028_101373 [Reichenbachiella agariperforans]
MNNKKKISLNDLDKKKPLEAPEGFFDSFSKTLENHIDQLESDKKTRRLLSRPYWVGIAATISLLLIISLIYWTPRRQQPMMANYLDEISSQEIAYYLELSDLDIETLLVEVDANLLATTEDNELMSMDPFSEEEMNLIMEQYEDVF